MSSSYFEFDENFQLSANMRPEIWYQNQNDCLRLFFSKLILFLYLTTEAGSSQFFSVETQAAIEGA